MLSQLFIRKSLQVSQETPNPLHHFYITKMISGYPILTAVNWPQHGCAISGCRQSHFIYLLTSFSGHRPARTGLRSHARCHPYPIPQPVKVGHTTGVYDPYSFQIVIFELVIYVPKEQISESTVTRDLRFSSLSKKTRKPNHLQMSLQRQHFLLSYLKTLSVGLAGVWTYNLPLGRLVLSQLS